MNSYRVEIIRIDKTGCCLVFSKYFESNANIKDNTYWKGNKCIIIQKLDFNGIETGKSST